MSDSALPVSSERRADWAGCASPALMKPGAARCLAPSSPPGDSQSQAAHRRLDDSKKLPLNVAPSWRPYQGASLCWAVAEIDAQRIDAWNIYQASRQAMTAALQQLTIPPGLICSSTPCSSTF